MAARYASPLTVSARVSWGARCQLRAAERQAADAAHRAQATHKEDALHAEAEVKVGRLHSVDAGAATVRDGEALPGLLQSVAAQLLHAPQQRGARHDAARLRERLRRGARVSHGPGDADAVAAARLDVEAASRVALHVRRVRRVFA